MNIVNIKSFVKEQKMNVDDVWWHDGLLDSLVIQGDGRVELKCRLYASSEASSRRNFSFEFSNVLLISCTIDVHALVDNGRAGNISNGRIEKNSGEREILKVFLVDGYLEVHAKNISINI